MNSPSCCSLTYNGLAVNQVCVYREAIVAFSSDMVYRLATQDVASTQLDPLDLQLYRSLLKIIGYVCIGLFRKGMCLCFLFIYFFS